MFMPANYGIKVQQPAADANPYAAFMNPAQTGRAAAQAADS